jgi:hypothetical protein
VSVYGRDREDAVFFLGRLRAWRRAGFVSDAQASAMAAAADPGLHRTGPFFRLLFFIFTMAAVQSVTGFSAWVLMWGGGKAWKVLWPFFAVFCWVAAERLARKGYYRHGMEEALALAGAGFGVGAVWLLVLDSFVHGDARAPAFCLTAVAAGLALFWRFGFSLGLLIALGSGAGIFFCVGDLPEATLRAALAVYFAGGFFLGARSGRRAFLEGFCLLAVYAAVNIQLPSLAGLFGEWKLDPPRVSGAFFWAAYALSFAVPAGLLFAGFRERRRVWLNAGLFCGVLTLCTNKSYLGWTRYAWDPVFLGALLIVVGWWGARRFRGRKSGWTSEEVWAPENHGLELGALGAAVLPPGPVRGGEGGSFGGVASGGGGAGRGF